MAKCKICGNDVKPPRRVYCCELCAQEARRAALRVKRPHKKNNNIQTYYEKTCQDCGCKYIGASRTKRCEPCQLAANRRTDAGYQRRKKAGKVRKIGSIDLCQSCGRPYTVLGPLQRYCKGCAPIVTRENIRARSRERTRILYSDPVERAKKNEKRHKPWKAEKTCEICGKAFMPEYKRSKFCSDECRKVRQKEQQHKADAKRAKQKKEAAKAARAAERNLPPEELKRIREERNARARANAEKRKQRKEQEG